MEHLKSKIRVLVTHQIQFIEKATKILILKEGGCLAYGSYSELQQMGIDFMSLLATAEGENQDGTPGRARSTSMMSAESSLSLHGRNTPILRLEVNKKCQRWASLQCFLLYLFCSLSRHRKLTKAKKKRRSCFRWKRNSSKKVPLRPAFIASTSRLALAHSCSSWCFCSPSRLRPSSTGRISSWHYG